MQIRFLTTAFCLLASGLAGAQAYKWVDAEGIVHYSDRPQPGAEVLDLPTSQRASAAPAARGAASDAEPQAEEPDLGYELFEVVSPAPEETLWNIQGNLNVSLSLQPALKPGHQIRAYFDGKPMMVTGTSFQIPEVYRGSHNIQAEVLDETGQLQIRSRTHRFYIQQTSVVQRARTTN